MVDLKIQPDCTRYFISEYAAYFFDMASNLNYAQQLVKYNFVRAETVQKARDSLRDEDIVDEQKLEYLFLIGFEFAGYVLNNYWLLSENLGNKVNDIVQKEFKGNYMIGMQFRLFYLDNDDIEYFLNCALDIEYQNKEIIGERQVKWFISSDDDVFIENLKNNYTDKIVTGEGKIGHVVLDPNAYERSILDIELLSKCDEMIITGGSTFGMMSSIKSQKRPYYFEGKRLMNDCKILRFFSPPITPNGAAIFK